MSDQSKEFLYKYLNNASPTGFEATRSADLAGLYQALHRRTQLLMCTERRSA